MWKLNLKLTYLLLFVCLCGGLMAQETTSEIVGVVSDGKTPLAGATVNVLNTTTGAKLSTTTRKEGRYNIPNLRVGGPYTVTVSFVGFKEEKQENIFLLLGQEAKADFMLSPSSTTLESVIVAAPSRQEKVINKNRTGSQEIISRTQMDRLPTINRSVADFVKLTPSASGNNIGGRNGFLNTVTVDGANLTNTFGLGSSPALGSQTNSQPISLDALEQIQVNVSPYDVRQGGFTGAGINSVTKSGTNQFKGSVYTFLRSPDIQGYKVGDVKINKQDYKYNQRGATIGGPIIKNKLFFFISGEQERLTQPGTPYLAADASHPAGGVISQANADTLTKLANFLKTNYNYDPGAFQNYSYRTQSDKLTVKLDYNINSNNTFTLKYNYLKSFREIQASNSGSVNSVNGRTPGTTALPFYGSGYSQNNNFNIVIGELNTRFSNKASNKVQIGYSALRDFRGYLSPGVFPLVDILDGSGNPFTSFGNEQYSYGNLLSTNIIQFSDIFTTYAGAHELSFGTQDNYKTYKNGFSPSFQGVYRFNSLADFYASAAPGATRAAARYDLSYAFSKDGSFPFATPKAFEFGLFAQDKWRVKQNFTLTYGVRVDVPFFQAEFTSNPNVPALNFRDGLHVDVGRKPSTTPLFSPRFGFNWDIKNDGKTQIRGGAGLFAGPPPFVWISNQASNNGVQFGSVSAGTGYVFSADVNKYRPTSGSNTAYSINVTDKDFKYPQVLKTTFAIDRKLPGDIVLTFEANYSKDVNNVNFENINLPTTGTPFVGSDNRIRYSSTKIYSGTTATNPNIGSAILMKNYSKGYAYYLTFQAQKTFKNLYINAAYTYSKSKDINIGGSTASTLWGARPVTGDPNAPELGYSNFYVPHRVIASASYKFSYAKHFATSIGLIFEASASTISEATLFPSASYVYSGDVNNDGNTANDLIYVPKDQNDIVLVPVNTGGGAITDTRTSAQIWSQLNSYIDQDKYLSKNRGKVAQRNGLIMPMFKRLDFNVTEEISMKTGKSDNAKHTLRITFDIINVGNMLSSKWGVAKTYNSVNILKYEGIAPVTSPDAGKPRYSFPYLDATKAIPLTSTFKDYTGLLSRWQGQVGIRYLFN